MGRPYRIIQYALFYFGAPTVNRAWVCGFVNEYGNVMVGDPWVAPTENPYLFLK